LINNAFLMAKDFYGNKKLQSKIDKFKAKGDMTFCESILTKVIPVYPELMVDPYGNYLC